MTLIRLLNQCGTESVLKSRLRPAQRAWLTLGIGVLIYDVLAPRGETLSEQVDRWLEGDELLTRLAVTLVHRHLTNDLAPEADPFHWLFLAARWTRKRFGAQ